MDIGVGEQSHRRVMVWTCVMLSLLVYVSAFPTYAQAPPSAIPFYPTYCNDRTGAKDCASGFARWIEAGISQRRPLYAEAGTYRLSRSQTVNLHAVATIGLSIFCDGPHLTTFAFDRNVAAPNLRFVGNDHPVAADSTFYLWVQGCGFRGATNGALVQVGRMDYGDAINEAQFINDSMINRSTGNRAIAVQLNFVLNGFINVVADTNHGFAALQCRACLFNGFFGSYSNADYGVVLEGRGNYGNVFNSVDVEGTTVSVGILSPGSTRNTFIGGQFALSKLGIDALAGRNNRFINPHFLGNKANSTKLVGVSIE